MSPGAALVCLALSAGGVRYPLHQSVPDFAAPGEPFKLVDLGYRLSDADRTTHAFLTRILVKDWGYLGAAFEGERRGVTWTTDRLVVAAAGESGTYDLAVRYRASWFLAVAEAFRRPSEGGQGWLLEPAFTARLSPSLEVRAAASTDSARPNDRFFRAASLGFLWQRAARFEAAGEASRSFVKTEAGFENTVDAALLRLEGQLGRLELGGDAFLEDTDGRFPHRDAGVGLGALLPLTDRLVASGHGRAVFEHEVGERSHEYGGGVAWYGRRFRQRRVGEAAARSLALARHATSLGANERLALDDDGRRLQRERLFLSRRRGQLRDDAVALYEAQVEERSVPLLGLELADGRDALSGTATRTARVLVGIPWPPAWPWRASEAAVPFLRLDLGRRRERSGPDFAAVTWSAALTASLNREMDLVLRWSRSSLTALDVIRGVGRPRTLELSYVYAFGR